MRAPGGMIAAGVAAGQSASPCIARVSRKEKRETVGQTSLVRVMRTPFFHNGKLAGKRFLFFFFQHVIEEAFLYWLCGLPVGITGIPSYTRALE